MSIQSEKLMGIVAEEGLEATPQAAFHKVTVGGRAIYIAKSKKVARVDLSGFDIKHPAVTRLTEAEAKELKLGKVRAQLDFSKSEERVLEAFRTALTMMKHLAEVPADSEAPTPALAKAANKGNRKKAISKKTKASKGRKTPPVVHAEEAGASA